MALPQETLKTIADIDALPEGAKAELIDGRLFFDTAPTLTHQDIVGFLHGTVFISPIDVQLNADDIYNLVQPDVAVVCDRDKLSDGKRCKGAPDWIMEVVSPSTKTRDYLTKLNKYQTAGVREYWIVDPEKEKVMVYNFETQDYNVYSFNDTIKVGIYPDLTINFAEIEL